MSFQQGLSGLNGAAKSLDVIGNNIANASTVGFKGSQAQFADVYAASLNGVTGNTAGIGTKVANIAQQFTQGNIEASNNPLDIAINGGGFFRTVTNGTTQYSRNGQFQLDKGGFMVNAQGAKLTGYQAGPGGTILAGAPSPIQINAGDLTPVATSEIDIELNLDSRSQPPTTLDFDVKDPTSYTKQIPIDVFDTLGNAHVMSTFYVKTSANTWDVYVANNGIESENLRIATASQGTGPTFTAVNSARDAWTAETMKVPQDAAAITTALGAYAAAASAMVNTAAGAAGAGAPMLAAITKAGSDAALVQGKTPEDIDQAIAGAIAVPPKRVGQLNFDSNGALLTPMPFKMDLAIFPATGAATPLPIEIDFTKSTQYGAQTSEKKIIQDGYTAGQLQRFSAGPDGIILGQYSNGKTAPLGQIVLSNFANPSGLTPLGNNAWAESSMSGAPLTGAPTTGSLGVLQASAVENSNVDLTAELVNMITAQRVYQANAQTIKTQDSILQTLVNLR